MARAVALAVAGTMVVLAIVFSTLSMRHAAVTMATLRKSPGYASAELAMQELLRRENPGGTVEIEATGSDGPGLRFVVARVRPGTPIDVQRTTAHEEGRYFLRMDQGWVYLPGEELNGLAVAFGKVLLEQLPRATK